MLAFSCREDEVVLNMSTYTPKEAVKNLRRNLLIFAGIPSTFLYYFSMPVELHP